ncbi:MAG: response regulator transcription factor [Bacteroidales bacterium]|nr:response regulator transcription factor [Bacteroidales bacterium]
MDTFNITIVDDHTLFRDGLKLLFRRCYKSIDKIYEASNGVEFLEQIQENKPDIVLMDIDMPLLNGVEATQKALEIYPDLKIIALTMFGDEVYYYKMIDAGVKGFLLKDSDINEVINAIETIRNNGNYFSEDLLCSVIRNIRTKKIANGQAFVLSEREIEVLREICKGYSNQEIADELNISKRTVDKHRANILEKTGSNNTASLVIYAIKNKLIEI